MLCGFCLSHVTAQTLYPGRHIPDGQRNERVRMAAKSFDLSAVRLLPSRFLDNMHRDSAYLMSMDVARLLHSFRTTAGVWSAREGGYDDVRKLRGWESLDCDLRGHTTGHILSALAQMYGTTGNEAFRAKGDSLVHGLAEVQQALHSGYLSAFPEGLIDRNMAGKAVWAPWYTLHKLMAGLLDQYLYADNKEALACAKGMADWAYGKLKDVDTDTRARMLRNEFGGTGECFLSLYCITGNEHDAWLSRFFSQPSIFAPLVAGRDELNTFHANTFLPKMLAEARRYELTGTDSCRRGVEYFWKEVTGHHTFCTGSVSDHEKFFLPDAQEQHLTGYTGEHCCTYNLMKLSNHLFCWSASPAVADYVERALYNHVLAQQDTTSGMMCYFLPMMSGAFKVFSTRDSSFWCCMGTGMEAQAKYAESIYFHSSDSLYVNLFIPSTLDWKEQGLRIRQQTSFPESDKGTLRIEKGSGRFAAIMLRRPSWATGAVDVRVNGHKVECLAGAGSYIPLCRKWKSGDVVSWRMDMKLHFETLPGESHRSALLYGPIVLVGDVEQQAGARHASFSNPNRHNDYYTYDYQVPTSVDDTLHADVRHPERSIHRRSGKLCFESQNGIRFIPLYDVQRQRYVTYWNVE